MIGRPSLTIAVDLCFASGRIDSLAGLLFLHVLDSFKSNDFGERKDVTQSFLVDCCYRVGCCCQFREWSGVEFCEQSNGQQVGLFLLRVLRL